MKFRLFILLTISLLTKSGYAQDTFTIRGTVKDAQSGKPMPFATVFFAETTYGTVTEEDGTYQLTVAKAGTYDLIVKFLGYKTYAAQLKLGDNPVSVLDISIEPDSKNLGSVTVTANKDKEWQNNMREFRRIFLGLSDNARQCKILNEEQINFYYDEEKEQLEAFSSEAIIIENKALGYKIQYFLEQFIVNYESNISSYYGYTIFEEMEPRNARRERVWENNRRIAYQGSPTHFFTSLYQNRLKEEGFVVQVAEDVTGFGRVINPRNADTYNFLKEGTTDISKILPFPNLLYITYNKEYESLSYSEVQRTGTLSGHASISSTTKKPQQSWISLMDGYESIEFEPSGYIYNPMAFYSAGYWGFEKVAEMVPINYRPKAKN